MNKLNTQCLLCERVALLLQGNGHPFLIHEFQHSLFVLGDHQFFRGYSMLLFKGHVRELHELDPIVQSTLFSELMIAGRAIADTFQPWKMNYSCYGNVIPHIHWHLFPRSDSDPDREQVPWFHGDKFEKHMINESAAHHLATQIRSKLILLQP
jgi:diadenosine tetraphosphate (Ap4A) HIT family hydrolase